MSFAAIFPILTHILDSLGYGGFDQNVHWRFFFNTVEHVMKMRKEGKAEATVFT